MEGLNLKAKVLDIDLGKFQVLLHKEDAEELGVHPGDRVRVHANSLDVIAVVDVTHSVVKPGTIGVFADVRTHFGVEDAHDMFVRPAEKPESVRFIKKKMHAKKLTREEIDQVILDTVNGSLTDIELAAWVTSLEINDMDMEEIEYLTRSMVKHGEFLDFGPETVVFDKHSIGGVPGNKISL
ncbi:MAG TPA: molybdopterin dinucleotide binding domain-containing protein, partial [Candidatus Thermoplasmatota archaeon]|nr:molybdopterin dinucleotide binding domain-containing protein [Candidatus Thermoplasmatota archaeon]